MSSSCIKKIKPSIQYNVKNDKEKLQKSYLAPSKTESNNYGSIQNSCNSYT